jgi:quinol-cytochrome oxidoreductase complex cytochrome b subunit
MRSIKGLAAGLVATTGWLALLCLGLALVTGVLLGWSYTPTEQLAHASVVDLEATSRFGRAVRSLHFLSSHVAVVLTLLHLVVALARRSFVRWLSEREAWTSWLFAGGGLACLLLLTFGGRILPWDRHGAISLTMLESFLQLGASNPVAALLGDAALRLQRLWMIHLLLSGLLVLCVVLHAPVLRRLREWREAGRPSRPVVPGLVTLVVLLVLAGLVRAPLGPAPLSAEGTPLSAEGTVAAEWYLRWLQYLALNSIELAQVLLAGLCLLGLVTPALARRVAPSRLRVVWLVVLGGLVLISLLPVPAP